MCCFPPGRVAGAEGIESGGRKLRTVQDEEIISETLQAPEVEEHLVGTAGGGVRLDVFLAARSGHSRSQIQDWIRQGRVHLDGRPAKASEKLREGQQILIERPPLAPAIPQPEEGLPLEIVYEDPHLLVVNKSRGVTIHPGSGAHSGTLVNALLAHCSDLSGIRGVERPGIVHRLDKDTSGLIVVAKDDRAHVGLSVQFAERSILKIYQALVHGVPPPRGTIEEPIARHRIHRQRMAVRSSGRSSRTDYEVLEAFGHDYSLLELHLHTGRTHQIRVHMTWLGFPLVGDPVYGRRPNPWDLHGQALHCRRLGFFHPVLNRPMEFEAPMPEVLQDILGDLRARYPAHEDPGGG